MKFKILLLLSVISIFTSCESDNSLDTDITETNLIGTWNIKEQTIEGSFVFVDNGQTQTASYEAYAKDISMSLTFGDNPKTLSAQGQYTVVTTVNFDDQTTTEEEMVEAISDPFENPIWVLNGNNITLSNDLSLPQNLIVESFIGNTLTLKAEIDETESDNGQTITVKTVMYFVLEK